jgi:hypothetical protein
MAEILTLERDTIHLKEKPDIETGCLSTEFLQVLHTDFHTNGAGVAVCRNAVRTLENFWQVENQINLNSGRGVTPLAR